ncbi:hypothetical protein V8C35DRAFT_181895 [Trichoderma chlorosporum]
MDLDSFDMYKFTTTGFRTELRGTVRPGFEIGWVTALKICLYFGSTLVAEGLRPNTLVIPDSDNRVSSDDVDEMEVEMRLLSMSGLKSFFEIYMPKVGANHQPIKQKQVTAALKVSPDGQQLTMSIDMANIRRLRPVLKSIKLSGKKLTIHFITENSVPFNMVFSGDCEFVLEQGQRHMAYFDMCEFFLDHDTGNHVIEGRIETRPSGMATLKGFNYKNVNSAIWLCYALRLFEMEVNLDEIVVE